MSLARLQLLLLLALILGYDGWNDPLALQDIKEIPDRCRGMIEQKIQFERVCRSRVHSKTAILARSPLIRHNQIMSIFLNRSNKMIFFTFRRSKLHQCTNLLVLHANLFNCTINGHVNTIWVNLSIIRCFPHPLYITDLEAPRCERPDKSLSVVKRLMFHTTQGVIHISHDETDSASRLPCHALAMLAMLIMFATTYLYESSFLLFRFLFKYRFTQVFKA